MVIITSNRTREIHDALKRRCVYHWIDYPTHEKELAIVRLKVPDISAQLAQQVVAFIQSVRQQEVYKAPGIAETLDWAEALGHLHIQILSRDVVNATLGLILKYQDDVDRLRGGAIDTILEQIQSVS
jgi:MoxR-like ATPase